MLGKLEIEKGRTVQLDGRPAQGSRHEILFGVMADSGEQVVVKVERIPGALERERTVLAWLGATQPGVAPKLVAFGEASLNGDRITCLVTERSRGSAPNTLEGWKRMGCALAQLADLGHPDHGLPFIGTRDFVRAHSQRISDLGSLLNPFVELLPDWEELCGRALPDSTPIVLTHGDPGPGNYLDDGTTGMLIDWEDAHVAPLGLDLGRLVFIALLGSGPAGYRARDQEARSRFVAAGYLNALARPWVPARKEVRWWVSVAAIQFIHRRWQLNGQPAPWEQAAAVLVTALRSD